MITQLKSVLSVYLYDKELTINFLFISVVSVLLYRKWKFHYFEKKFSFFQILTVVSNYNCLTLPPLKMLREDQY